MTWDLLPFFHLYLWAHHSTSGMTPFSPCPSDSRLRKVSVRLVRAGHFSPQSETFCHLSTSNLGSDAPQARLVASAGDWGRCGIIHAALFLRVLTFSL